MAGVIFVTQAEIEFAERNPATFAAPAHVDDLLPVREQAGKCGAGFRRQRFFHSRLELVGSGFDAKHGHGDLRRGSTL
jgi:hypothetical protein